MKEAIERVGEVDREVGRTLFEGIALQVIGQQISSSAFSSIRHRLGDSLLSPEAALSLSKEHYRFAGISLAKAECILDIAKRFQNGYFDDIASLTDDEVRERLIDMKGIGSWTADMVLLFALGREDVFTIKDAGIVSGLKKLYGFKTVSKERGERLGKRYSPYGSMASLILWEVAKWK